MQHQQNKADNIRLACSKMNGIVVRPGETFSFWKLVGKTSRRNGFAEGRVIINGRLVAGVGGGLCNLANTINAIARKLFPAKDASISFPFRSFSMIPPIT